MSKRILLVSVVCLVALLIGTAALGAFDLPEQVLGGPPRESSASHERSSYCDEQATKLQTGVLGRSEEPVRALVVFRRYVRPENLRNVIGGLPIHYLRAGLAGNDDPLLEHFTVQLGSEVARNVLSPEEFVDGYVAGLLDPEIAWYAEQAAKGNLPQNALEYLSALKSLRETVRDQLCFYAIGVEADGKTLRSLLTSGEVELVDAVYPNGPGKVRYMAPMPE